MNNLLFTLLEHQLALGDRATGCHENFKLKCLRDREPSGSVPPLTCVKEFMP